MADIADDFLTFLKAYFPEDYGKVSRDNVSDSVVVSVMSKHKDRFNNWLKVPQTIRDEYFGRVPSDILRAAQTDNNLTVDECRDIEDKRTYNTPSYISDELGDGIVLSDDEKKTILNNAMNIMMKGYAFETAVRLSKNAAFRSRMEELEKQGEITHERHMQIRQDSRKDDKKSIKTDWANNQPEKLLINIIKKIDAGKISAVEAIPQAFELYKALKEKGREAELEELLRQPVSRYNKWNNTTREIFEGIRQSQASESLTRTAKYLDDKRSITNDWAENQPEKLIVNIAKKLSLGKINKEDAKYKINNLMLKIKEKGRESELEAYLQSPVSKYSKWNEETRVLLSEIMQSHDVGVVAQSLNKVRSMAKDQTTAEQTALPPSPAHKTVVKSPARQQYTVNKQGRV